MNNINLVPSQYKETIKRRRYIGASIMGGILIIIVVAFCLYLPIRKIKILKNEQVVLDQQLNHRELKEIEAIIIAIQENKEQQLNIQHILKEIDIPSHIKRTTMDIIINSVPNGLRINEIMIDEKENIMSISGKAESVKNIVIYVVNLHYIKIFEAITYTTHNNTSKIGDWVDYNLEIKLKKLIDENEDNKDDMGIEINDELY